MLRAKFDTSGLSAVKQVFLSFIHQDNKDFIITSKENIGVCQSKMMAGSGTIPHTHLAQHHSIAAGAAAGNIRPPHCCQCRGRQRQLPIAAAHGRVAQQGTQRLFLDSADVKQWHKWAPTGTLYGFTTNPLILDRDGVPCTLDACKQLLTTVC